MQKTLFVYFVSIPQAVCTRCNQPWKYIAGKVNKFQYRKRYVRVATSLRHKIYFNGRKFQYRKRYGPVATEDDIAPMVTFDIAKFQYRKRYGPVATKTKESAIDLEINKFQYRKRYGPVATETRLYICQRCDHGFNTASGMAQLQRPVLYPSEVCQLVCFNTASGMAQLQHAFKSKRAQRIKSRVSIPQAVWPSCNLIKTERRRCHETSFNTASGMAQLQQRPWNPAPGQG